MQTGKTTALLTIILLHTSCSAPPQRYQPPTAPIIEAPLRPNVSELNCIDGGEVAQIANHAFGCFLDGKRHGPSWEIYDNGSLYMLSSWARGKLEGTQTTWTEEGFPLASGQWHEDQWDGLTLHWHLDPPGAVESISEYEDGKQVGEWLLFHPNGIAKRKGTYVYGFPHGEFMQWSEEGKLLGTYRMEYGSGDVREWHENGALASSQYWMDGKPKYKLAHQWYNEDGTLQKYRIMWGDGTYWETRYNADGTETETCIDGPCPE